MSLYNRECWKYVHVKKMIIHLLLLTNGQSCLFSLIELLHSIKMNADIEWSELNYDEWKLGSGWSGYGS